MTKESDICFDIISIDTLHFGYPCAICYIPKEFILTNADIEKIKINALIRKIKFLTIASPEPVNCIVPQAPGPLYEYEGIFKRVKERASGFKLRYRIQQIGCNNWNHVEELAKYRSENRFSTDLVFCEHEVFTHKLALYKLHMQRFPNLAFLAYSKNGDPLGYHFCSFDTNERLSPTTYNMVLYDLVVHPNYRMGLVALDLINASLNAASKNALSPHKILTNIYSNNKFSEKFFTELGLKKNEKKQYFYHIWL
jgi:hypothetical protein